MQRMSPRVAASIAVLAVLVGAWLALPRGPAATPRAPVRARDAGADADAATLGSNSQFSARLQRALRSAPPRPAPRRNPFVFASQTALPPGGTRDLPIYTPPVAVAPAPPVMTLAGVATTDTPDGPVRTAVISTRGQVLLVKAGDALPLGLSVVRVDDDRVVLADAAGVETTLRLK